MNDGELRVLEYVRSQIDAVREDLRDMRNEFMTQFMQHDGSDNKRFSELFERIRPLEIGQAVQQHKEKEETGEETRWHNWQIALLAGLCALAAPVLAAVATAKLLGH